MFADERRMQTDISRMLKGQKMIENGVTPEELQRNIFNVPSQSGNGEYKVIKNLNTQSGWSCECPDHAMRGVECKHIHAVRFWLALKEKMTIQQQEDENLSHFQDEGVESYETLICVHCGSQDIIGHGTRNTKTGNKTRMLCCQWKHTFTLENEAGFEKMQVSSKIVTIALDLYFKSTSLRKITDHLDQFYECKIHHTTVLNWAKKYGKIMSEYADTLKPELGNIWHTDEMKIKNKRDGWAWLWHVMDNSTRYMIANLVTKQREKDDAKEVFSKAKKHNEDEKPDYVVTDGLQSYQDGFNEVFYDNHRSCTYVRAPGLKARTNNNKIERLHNTVRERFKTMRGLQNDDTATTFNDGFRAYYNHIRLHQGLNGSTPAQAAGVDLELGRNRWMGFILKGLEHQRNSDAL